MDILTEAKAWAFVVPKKLGGAELKTAEILPFYKEISAGDLCTSLLFANRNSAIATLCKVDNLEPFAPIIEKHRDGWLFAGLGIHRTNSPKRTDPGKDLFVKQVGNEFIMEGVSPWISGAINASEFLVQGILEDGRKANFWVPSDSEGVIIEPPIDLLGLSGSCTSHVKFTGVRIPRHYFIQPISLKNSAASPIRFWATAIMALGVAEKVLAYLNNSDLEVDFQAGALEEKLCDLETQIYADVAQQNPDVKRAQKIRARTNEILIKLAGLLMLCFKGTGFVAASQPQTLASQCLFFSVFVLPNPLRRETVAVLMEHGW